jgi:hypothetical protein
MHFHLAKGDMIPSTYIHRATSNFHHKWIFEENKMAAYMNSKKLRCSSLHLYNQHSWTSASRSMPPASAFRHPVFQSGTGAFRYRTGSPYSGTELVPASEFLFIPVPD